MRRLRAFLTRGPWWRRLLTAAGLLFVVLPLFMVLVFRVLPVPVTPLMLIRLVEGHGLSHDWVSYDEIAPVMARSAIAAEDGKFCDHFGFDWEAINDALDAADDGARLRGGSTISQQTAKNVFLWPGRSWIRKGLEAGFTVLIETVWGKRRILEVYLNSVEFGPGIYGVEAAARHHFGTSAAALTARQAALLAAVLPNPIRFSAAKPSAYVNRYATRIEGRARAIGKGMYPPCD
ncbi:monofunctional biosynthetic peptidoglycan transglycosylase [Zavarzinia sp.]|uniref:monofunctional biosynthetic peptidoglycan transglycosylase n=1 Tax=Zavarzinia sp. TaxID=2027920 RepID=UPI003BB5AC90